MRRLHLVAIFMVFILMTQLSVAQNKHRSISWEKFQSSGPQLTQIGYLATKNAHEIKSSPWSIGCETLDRDYGDFKQYKEYVGQLGVKHARIQSGWAKCEKEKGIYDFAWLDSIVYGLLEEGVEPWISLSYGNPIYKSEFTLGAGVFTDDETMWMKYVEATVSRYKDVVNEWEIWNEPNHRESPLAYANLLINSIETVKKVQPKGQYWCPGEADFALRKWTKENPAFQGGWFWHEGEDRIRTLEDLKHRYYETVGRNTNLLLGIVVDDRGLIPKEDSIRMVEFGDFIETDFSNPAKTTSGEGKLHVLKMDQPTPLNYVVIQEDITQGEQVRAYTLHGKSKNEWVLLSEGQSIGHNRIELMEGDKIEEVKLEITSSIGSPVLKNIAWY